MDSVDSYVLRMSQVAAMLNYGEMQILENFKNTLPYRLYSTLINVNNLRDTIDLAKQVLTKEKLDRQLTGQSSTPFMKATSNNDCHSSQNQQKKGVTFDATNQKYTRAGHETKMLDGKILLLEIDPLVEEGIKAIETITGKIIEIDQEAGGTTTGQVIGVVITQITTDEVIRDRTIDKTHNGHLETEVKVEVEMKIMTTINLEVEVGIEIKGDEKNPGLDLI